MFLKRCKTLLLFALILLLQHAVCSSLESQKQSIATVFKSYNVPLIDINDECSDNALEGIMSNCEHGHINKLLRIKTAIDLTICLLPEALPEKCDESKYDLNEWDQLNKCVASIKTNQQLWTTYFGYYKLTDQLCYTLRFPYEQKLMLVNYKEAFDRFVNLAEVIDLMRDELVDLNELFFRQHAEAKAAMLYELNEYNQRYKRSMEEYKEQMETHYNYINKKTEKLKNELEYLDSFNLSFPFELPNRFIKYTLYSVWFLFVLIYCLRYLMRSANVFLVCIILITAFIAINIFPPYIYPYKQKN